MCRTGLGTKDKGTDLTWGALFFPVTLCVQECSELCPSELKQTDDMSWKAQQLPFTAHFRSSAHEQLKTSLKCVFPPYLPAHMNFY